MTDYSSPLSRGHAQARQALHRASPFVEKFARLGYAAKGVVYIIIGSLAATTAFGRGGQTTDSRGALATLLNQPFGQVLLGIVAVGLAAYSLWQFIRAVEDPENEGSDGKAIAKRIGFFISGMIHLGLVFAAVNLIIGSGGGSSSGQEGAQGWTATVMSYPLGRWAVAIAGLIIAGFALVQVYHAWKADLDDQLTLGQVSSDSRRWIIRISRFGIAARGVVFLIIGFFLLVAALQHDPSEARGLGGVLRTLQRQPYGPWLLAVVALGLIGYGIYEFVRARYRRIEVA